MKPSQSNRKGLHPRNLHQQSYDFSLLIKSFPPLKQYVTKNEHGNLSINFAQALAVKTLNTALLKHHYKINGWDIPKGALCPPVPGRVDYIHYVAELLGVVEATTHSAQSKVATQQAISLLDIGTGANGIYPLLASQVYGWNCVASDINTQSLENVASIIAANPQLKKQISLRKQADKNHFFKGIIQPNEFFNVTVCNPPFHASLEEALKTNQRKVNNLERNRKEATSSTAQLNFGGSAAELWCKGGEKLFLKKLIKESLEFSEQCHWFTSLVSKSENLKPSKKLLNKLAASDIRVIEMIQGNKITRILTWTFK